MKRLAFAVALLVPSVAAAQDQVAIDKAIKRGIEYLKTAGSPGHEHSGAKHSDELILLTFIHAEVPETDPKFKALLQRVLTDEPAQTYKVALQAMCLEELDRVKYQGRIAQCAQFLVDNQCQNGQWTYGDPTTYSKDLPSTDLKADVASGTQPKKAGVLDFSKTGPKPKPKIVRTIAIKKQKDGPASGDNSNTQYAALGLRACYDAGIIIEESVIQRAVKWLLESQHPPEDGAAANAVASGGDARPRGWNYKLPEGDAKAYGSMTAGAVGCLTIYDYMLKKDWKRNPAVNSGIAWLAKHYSVTDNPGRGGSWYRYYLYGLERAAILYDTQKIGDKDWYADGAKALLSQQDANGAWDKEWDTCFAILFLKKATRPLVATDGGKRK